MSVESLKVVNDKRAIRRLRNNATTKLWRDRKAKAQKEMCLRVEQLEASVVEFKKINDDLSLEIVRLSAAQYKHIDDVQLKLRLVSLEHAKLSLMSQVEVLKAENAAFKVRINNLVHTNDELNIFITNAGLTAPSGDITTFKLL